MKVPFKWDWPAISVGKLSSLGFSRFSSHIVCSIALSVVFATFGLVPRAQGAAPRPNIIFILMDDLRWDEMDYPFVKVPNIQRIAREGVKFSNAFVTTPLCSPS